VALAASFSASMAKAGPMQAEANHWMIGDLAGKAQPCQVVHPGWCMHVAFRATTALSRVVYRCRRAKRWMQFA